MFSPFIEARYSLFRKDVWTRFRVTCLLEENATSYGVRRSASGGASAADASAISAGRITAPPVCFCFGGSVKGPAAIIVRAYFAATLRAGNHGLGRRSGD